MNVTGLGDIKFFQGVIPISLQFRLAKGLVSRLLRKTFLGKLTVNKILKIITQSQNHKKILKDSREEFKKLTVEFLLSFVYSKRLTQLITPVN